MASVSLWGIGTGITQDVERANKNQWVEIPLRIKLGHIESIAVAIARVCEYMAVPLEAIEMRWGRGGDCSLLTGEDAVLLADGNPPASDTDQIVSLMSHGFPWLELLSAGSKQERHSRFYLIRPTSSLSWASASRAWLPNALHFKLELDQRQVECTLRHIADPYKHVQILPRKSMDALLQMYPTARRWVRLELAFGYVTATPEGDRRTYYSRIRNAMTFKWCDKYKHTLLFDVLASTQVLLQWLQQNGWPSASAISIPMRVQSGPTIDSFEDDMPLVNRCTDGSVIRVLINHCARTEVAPSLLLAQEPHLMLVSHRPVVIEYAEFAWLCFFATEADVPALASQAQADFARNPFGLVFPIGSTLEDVWKHPRIRAAVDYCVPLSSQRTLLPARINSPQPFLVQPNKPLLSQLCQATTQNMSTIVLCL